MTLADLISQSLTYEDAKALALVFGQAPYDALLAAILAGAGKELHDRWSGKGTPELADFLVTVGGGVAGMAAHALLLWH